MIEHPSFFGECGMDITAVYLDGGYIDNVLHRDHRNARLDYQKLVSEMARPNKLLRAYYYTCMPYQSSPPTQKEKERYASMHDFITALRYLTRFEVRLGQLAISGVTADGFPNFVQKRVDCMIGVDMTLLAAKRIVTNIALFSGDSDLIPAIDAVKREGVLVTLWHGSFKLCPPSRELCEICDERKELTSEVFKRIQRR